MRSGKKLNATIFALSAATYGLGLASHASAASYTWNQPVAGTYTWDTNGSWTTAGDPSAAGDVADLQVSLSGTGTLTVDTVAANLSMATIQLGDTSTSAGVHPETIISTSSSHTITMDNGSSAATITVPNTNTMTNTLTERILLNSNLNITMGKGRLAITGNSRGIIGGAHTITVGGGASGENLYIGSGGSIISSSVVTTGITVNSGGQIRMSGGSINNVLQSDVSINNGGTVIDGGAGQDMGLNTLITLAGTGNWNIGGFAETCGALAGGNSSSSVGVTALSTLLLDGATNSASNTYSGTLSLNALTLTGGVSTVQTLAGSTADVTGLVTVNSGQLQLNMTGVVGVSGGLTINGGSVKFDQSSQLASTSAVTLAGGTLNMNGFNQTVSPALTLSTGSSSIDMGAGNAGSILALGDSSLATWSGTASILDWTGNLGGGGIDQIDIGTSADLTSGQLADLSFVNPNGITGTFGAIQLPSGEVVPSVPEPASLGLLGGLGSLLMLRRRRN